MTLPPVLWNVDRTAVSLVLTPVAGDGGVGWTAAAAALVNEILFCSAIYIWDRRTPPPTISTPPPPSSY